MLRHRFVTLGAVALVVLLSVPIYPLIGTELFPRLDTGQFAMQMRAPSGTRIEKTEQYVAEVEAAITEEIAAEDLQILISNTGVLYDWPAAYTRNAGPMDSSLMIQLREEHGTPSFEYVRRLRRRLREQFPMIEFSFETGGMISSAINFGLPAPINIQVNGNQLDVAQQIARDVKALVESVPGTADVRIQQKLDYPQLSLEIDRAKAALLGINADEAVRARAVRMAVGDPTNSFFDHVRGSSSAAVGGPASPAPTPPTGRGTSSARRDQFRREVSGPPASLTAYQVVRRGPPDYRS